LNRGIRFVWGCACLLVFPYKKAHLRAVFRPVNPAPRKSAPTTFLRTMRRAAEILRTQLPTQLNRLLTCRISIWATKLKFRLVGGLFGWCLGRVGCGLGTETALLLVPPPNFPQLVGCRARNASCFIAIGVACMRIVGCWAIPLLKCGGSPLCSAVLSARLSGLALFAAQF